MSGTKMMFEKFMECFGNWVWVVLFVISVLYILWRIRPENRKKMLLTILLVGVFLYNGLTFRLLSHFVTETDSFYRFFWLIPITLVCAYAFVLFWTGKQNRIVKSAISCMIAVALVVAGDSYFDYSKTQSIENPYLMPDDVLGIATMIAGDKEEDMPTIAMPMKFELVYRTYDASAIMGIGRAPYAYFSSNGYEAVAQTGHYLQESRLARLVENGEKQDVLMVKSAIIDKEIDYLIINNHMGLEDYMTLLDCTLVGSAKDYSLYRVNYNSYDKVTKKEEVQKIKDAMGISEDEETVELEGLEKEYRILAVNDLHDFLLDDSVMEEKIETVYDRYNNLFLSATGVHSADLWNGMSAILDSYQTDGIVFIGDMIDYSSKENIRLFKNGLENVETPYIYLRADHDLGAWYTTGENSNEETMGLSKSIAEYQEVFVKDYGEFYLVGWNNSTSPLSQEGLERMKEIFAEGKPIILATHVPLDSIVDDGLRKAAMEADPEGRAKLWGENCLYRPNETTQEFLDMVYAQDSPVKAVFAGHLHFKYTVQLTDNITEYVLPPAFSGKITQITIK